MSATVNLSVSDSSDARAIDEIYYQWVKAQGAGIVGLPNKGTAPNGDTLVIGVPIEILPMIRERGITITEVRP